MDFTHWGKSLNLIKSGFFFLKRNVFALLGKIRFSNTLRANDELGGECQCPYLLGTLWSTTVTVDEY